MTPYPRSNESVEGTQTADRRWRLANAIRNAERERDWLREAVFDRSMNSTRSRSCAYICRRRWWLLDRLENALRRIESLDNELGELEAVADQLEEDKP